jgi:hypothetical protein
MKSQSILIASVGMGFVLGVPSWVSAGPTFIQQKREISIMIPDFRGTPNTQRVSTMGDEPFDQNLLREYRNGSPPSNDDGVYGYVSQQSTMSANDIRMSGRVEADTLYSSDGTSSGVAADIESMIQVRFRIDEPTNVLLQSFVTRIDESRPEPLKLMASVSGEANDSNEEGTVLEQFNFGFGDQSRNATLEPGTYTFNASVMPEGYNSDGQWSVGDYALSLSFAPISTGSRGDSMGGGANVGANVGGTGTEVIPLPGQSWISLAVLGAVVVLVMRNR